MAKYITEVLKEINDKPELLLTTYRKHGDGGPLGIIFNHAFDPNKRFILPDGTPPFKESPEPLGMTPAQFISETRKFYIFCREDIRPLKREQVFVQMLESIHPKEAEILIAIKDQTLDELYPNITRPLLEKAQYIAPFALKRGPVKLEPLPPDNEEIPDPDEVIEQKKKQITEAEKEKRREAQKRARERKKAAGKSATKKTTEQKPPTESAGSQNSGKDGGN